MCGGLILRKSLFGKELLHCGLCVRGYECGSLVDGRIGDFWGLLLG